MKYGKVLTYADIEEAKKLIGKKVVASDNLFSLSHIEDCKEPLISILYDVSDYMLPFAINKSSLRYQFIREVIEEEPQYRPFTCVEARKHIGKVVRRDRDVFGVNCPQYNILHSVIQESVTKLSINGVMAEDFVKNWVFDDTNKPCGVEVEK